MTSPRDLLEPAARNPVRPDDTWSEEQQQRLFESEVFSSIAISMKRIADNLEVIKTVSLRRERGGH